MQDILESIESNKLLAAMTSNMAAFWVPYGRASGSTLQATSKVVWFYTGIPIPILNGVLLARMQPADAQATIAELQQKIEAQGAPALWWIAPDSTPSDLGSLLEQNGLQYTGTTPGMAVDLAIIEDEARQVTNFRIAKVNDRDMQALWARVAGIGTGFPEIVVEPFVQLEASLGGAEYKAQHRYIGFLDGVPVATSALVLDSGVAGIYAVATLPEARRRGIGRVITVQPLIEARELGYRVGILQSSSMGYGVYQKIGFREICKYSHYLQSSGQE